MHVGTTTADTPSQLDTDLKTQGGHEWRSVDISNYAEVEAATAGTDLSVSEASSLAFPCSGRAAASEAESDVPILCIITIRTCVGSLSCLSYRGYACGQVVLSVVRTHPKVSFDVNATGVYNACKAAIAHGHTRLINTGPWSATPPILFLYPALHIATGLRSSQWCLASLWLCLSPFAPTLAHGTALPWLSLQVCRRRSRQDLLPQGQRGDAGADGPRPVLLLEGRWP